MSGLGRQFRVRLLGRFERFTPDGMLIDPEEKNWRKPDAPVLAQLALHGLGSGSPVSESVIKDRCWEVGIADNESLRQSISRIRGRRRVYGVERQLPIKFRSSIRSYSLELPREAVDATYFIDAVAAGPPVDLTALCELVSLWRGNPLRLYPTVHSNTWEPLTRALEIFKEHLRGFPPAIEESIGGIREFWALFDEVPPSVEYRRFCALVSSARGRLNSPSNENYDVAWGELTQAFRLLPNLEGQLTPDHVADAELDLFKVGMEQRRFEEILPRLQARFDGDPSDARLCRFLAELLLKDDSDASDAARHAQKVIDRHRRAIRDQYGSDARPSERILGIEREIRQGHREPERGEPLGVRIRFSYIPWLDASHVGQDDRALSGEWVQITFEPTDHCLEEEPLSIEWASVCGDGNELSGTWWRIWRSYFDRKWTFNASLVDESATDGDVVGHYVQKRGNGGSGTFTLWRRSSSLYVGFYSRPLDAKELGSDVELPAEAAPMVWMRPEIAAGSRIAKLMKAVESARLLPHLPPEQHEMWQRLVSEA